MPHQYSTSEAPSICHAILRGKATNRMWILTGIEINVENRQPQSESPHYCLRSSSACKKADLHSGSRFSLFLDMH